MKYRVVYAVVCDAEDVKFADWAFTSIQALRHLEEAYQIVLCVDEKTQSSLKEVDHKILNACDEIKVIDTLDGTLRERSRWLKTNLRGMVDGDFVYLDSDAIPVKDLTELYTQDTDFAAVNVLESSPELKNWLVQAMSDLEWDISSEQYFNAGVFFIRDTRQTREFGELWKQKWLVWREFDQSGVSADQPSFNSALCETDMKKTAVSERFNTFMSRPNSCHEASVVFHYPASFRPMKYSSLLSRLTRELSASGTFNFELFETAQRHNNPWVMPKLFVWAEFLASGISHRVKRFFRSLLSKEQKRKLVR